MGVTWAVMFLQHRAGHVPSGERSSGQHLCFRRHLSSQWGATEVRLDFPNQLEGHHGAAPRTGVSLSPPFLSFESPLSTL